MLPVAARDQIQAAAADLREAEVQRLDRVGHDTDEDGGAVGKRDRHVGGGQETYPRCSPSRSSSPNAGTDIGCRGWVDTG
ncbi:hypothetical protein WEH80_39955 [Actinomycetes bacterium KLBMP 9759]